MATRGGGRSRSGGRARSRSGGGARSRSVKRATSASDATVPWSAVSATSPTKDGKLRRGGVAGPSNAGGGRYGAVVGGERYESYEGWKVAAGVATGIAIGTMLARPPSASVTVVT